MTPRSSATVDSRQLYSGVQPASSAIKKNNNEKRVNLRIKDLFKRRGLENIQNQPKLSSFFAIEGYIDASLKMS